MPSFTYSMPKLSDLTVRLLHPTGYSFVSGAVQARQVREVMLEDHLIDFSRWEPEHRPATENDFLQLNDVVVGFHGREMFSVGIYHPEVRPPEPVTLGSFTVAFRAHNLAEAVSILAGLIYRLDRPGNPHNLELSALRVMPITLLYDQQIIKFLAVIKTVHEMRKNMREREKTLRELIPATIHKFYVKDLGGEPAVAGSRELR
jgi:hypothetical protein